MRVKQISKTLALLMIYLIISLTFFSASVLATIFKAEGMGQDQAPGVIRSTDNLVIKTESVMPCSVSGEFTNNTFIQMNCGSGTPMSCAYTKQVTNVTGTLGAVVMESGSEETKDIVVYVDNSPPTIISLATSSLGNKIKATYNIKDTANENSLDKCGGIKKVELLLNNQVVNSTNHTVGLCTVNSFLTGTIANYLGKVNTSIKVQDYVGLGANATGSEVFIDTTPPRINTGAKVYYPGTTDEIKTISTNSTKERTADVMVTISENALSPSDSVFGDFHLLDKTNTSTQSSVAATCTRLGWNETYECTFSGIKLMPSSASTPINIIATDQAGNAANQSLSLTFTVVNTAGTVIRVGPEPSRCIGSTCYVKAGTNNITADISSSSSFNQSDVLIQGTKAECARVSNWQCRADAVIRTGATFIEVTGTDDLGNVLSGRGNITVDSIAPVKIGVLNTTPDCPTSKESLKITLNASEAQSPSLKIRARTDSISTNNETAASCSKIGTTSNWQCILTVSNLKSEGINTNLAVIVEDFAGNQLVESVPVKICVEVNEIPELIEKIKTTGILPKIDRKTVSKITVKVPLSLQIILKEPSVELTQRTTVSCEGTPGLSGQAYMIDDTGLKPTLVVPLSCKAGSSCEEAWEEAGKVLINCTQEFNIKHGNKIYTQRETESITAELEYYNQPLGSVDAAFNTKIKEIKTELQKLDKEIKTRNTVHSILGFFCNLAETMGAINSLLMAVKSVLYGVAMGIHAFLPTAPAAQALWSFTQGALGGTQNFIDSFIWPQGWIPTGGNTVGLIVKGACSIYTCKFYDMNTWVDIGMSIGASMATKNDPKYIVDKEGGVTGYDPKTGYTEFTNKNGVLTKSIDSDGRINIYAADGKISNQYTPVKASIPTGMGTPGVPVTVAYVDQDGNYFTFDPTTNQFNQISIPAVSAASAQPAADTRDDSITINGKKYTVEYITDENGNKLNPTGAYYDEDGEIYMTDDSGYITVDGKKYFVEYETDMDGNQLSPTGRYYDEEGNIDSPSTQTSGPSKYTTKTTENGQIQLVNPQGETVGTFNSKNSDVSINAKGEIIITNKASGLSSAYDPVTGTLTPIQTDQTSASRGTQPPAQPTVSPTTPTVVTETTAPEIIKSSFPQIAKDPGQYVFTITKVNSNDYSLFIYSQGPNGPSLVGNKLISADEYNKLKTTFLYGRSLGKFYTTQNPGGGGGGGGTAEVIASDSITGNDIISGAAKTAKTLPPFTSSGYNTFDLNYRLETAVDAFLGDDGSWIFNPYKSKHYDSLCAPAILFNDRKEKQLLCKRLVCLESMNEMGGPIEACDFEYNLDMCMYVESARYKIEGSANIGRIFAAVGRAFFSNLLGTAVVATYMFIFPGCVHYQVPGGATLDVVLAINGWRSAACGLTGSLLSAREIAAFVKNDFNPLTGKAPTDPVKQSGGNDFCSGVDYSS